MNPDPSGGLLAGINVLFAVAGMLLLIGFVVALVIATVRGSIRASSPGVDWDRELRSLSGRPSIEDQLAEIERRFAADLITADEREALRTRVLSSLRWPWG